MVTKYEKGDIVRVRSDLVVGEVYNDITLLSTMNKFVGKTWEIRNIVCENNHIDYELDNGYYWSEIMLESIEEEKHMLAEELLEWFKENYNNHKVMVEVFGLDFSFSDLICAEGNTHCYNSKFSISEIISKIDDYERNKKQKEEKTEFRIVFRIIEDKDRIKKCVDEKLMNNDCFSEKQLNDLASEYLKSYCNAHEGNFFCTYQRNCYVKGN